MRLFRVQGEPDAVRAIEQRPRRRQMVEQHAETQAFAGAAVRGGGDGEPVDAPGAAQPQTTLARSGPRVGRNDPCPCGSGKKYKKCHMLIDEGVGTR